jgi:hypothetical protein
MKSGIPEMDHGGKKRPAAAAQGIEAVSFFAAGKKRYKRKARSCRESGRMRPIFVVLDCAGSAAPPGAIFF